MTVPSCGFIFDDVPMYQILRDEPLLTFPFNEISYTNPWRWSIRLQMPQKAFEDSCEWIPSAFDYFHIVENFNDKVVREIRKDEQLRLYEEGNIYSTTALKKAR